MKIGSVVVLYNFNNLFIENLKLLQKYVDFIVLVDNSDVSSIGLLEEFIGDKLVYLPLMENLGIAIALNKGMEVCITEHCDWVLTLDQDSALDSNIVGIYKKYIHDNACVSIMGLCPQYFTYQYTPRTDISNVRVETNIQSGILFNVENYKKLGAFKDKYFIDYVDFEYCYRANKKGYIFMRCNEAILTHNRQKDIFNKDYKYYREIKFFSYKHHYIYPSEIRTYYVFRNGLDVFFTYGKFIIIYALLTRILKCILFENNKVGQFKAMLHGFCDYTKMKYGKNV